MHGRRAGADLVKEAGKVDLDHIPTGGIHQDVLAVSVAQAGDMAHHGPHGRGACPGQARRQPRSRLREAGQEPAVEARRERRQQLLHQPRLALILGHADGKFPATPQP